MEMETQIEKIARTRLEAEELHRLRAHSKEITERIVKLEKILEDFKRTFKDVLPLLDEARITYSAHFNSNYEYAGSYILFERQIPSEDPREIIEGVKKTRTVKMDFNNGISYRYEYVFDPRGDHHGTKCFGSWPVTELILFIYNGLFK